MENKVQQFLNDNFGEVRVVTKDNEIWFCADDIAKAIGHTNTSKMVSDSCEEFEVTTLTISYSGNMQTNKVFISESGLYAIAMKSRKPQAKEFRIWVTKEVIPAIRKDGSYISGEEKLAAGEMSEEEFILKAMTMMQSKIERLTKENIEMKPKAEYHDKVLEPTTYTKLVSTTEIAKDLGMTAQALNKKLKEIKFIYKDRSGIWCLYKEYQNLIPEYADYSINEHGQTLKYTEKGRKYILDLLKNN